ncbi:RDD family protein [Botryobacter ruber]|uniref:RDD family protein n=1 Tax=Botryobacter ruber TaxID=2171629 RepID=UPI001F0C19E3|nr:RDD family protein [Botryobacter ruber]
MKKSSLYGSFNSRLVAMLIDNILLIFWYSIIFNFSTDDPQLHANWETDVQTLNFRAETLLLALKSMFFNVYFPVGHWLYYTLLEASPKQATIGKFTLGLKVTDLRGKRINLLQANLRYFTKFISLLPLMLGFFLVFFSRRKQTLHDFVARTVIVSHH